MRDVEGALGRRLGKGRMEVEWRRKGGTDP